MKRIDLQTTGTITEQSFFEHYAEAVLISAADGIPIFVNKAFTQLTGFEMKDLALFDLKALNHTGGEASHTPVEHEKIILRKDNAPLEIKISKSNITLHNGQTGWVYTLTDYSETARLKKLLQASETGFISLAEASPAMIYLADTANQCFYFNKSWLDYTGTDIGTEAGTGWLSHVHPDDLKIFAGLEATVKKRESYTCEFRFKRHDNQYRNIYAIGTPRFAADRNFEGYMNSCLDITEMKVAQAELLKVNNELKRSNEELEQFAYVTSHDLQEPLRMIMGYVHLIEKNIAKGNTENLGEFIKYSIDGVTRAQALIADLLQFSRVNRKGNPFAPVNVNEVLHIALNNLSVKIKETGAEVIAPSLPIVNGDTFQLIRLFQNLIDNAIKFQAPGRKPVIKISVGEKENSYLFGIEDNGIGIENKFYNRIFVIFQRLHTRNEYEGTGIGLAVCKKIVERHGGEIWVESKAGEESIFYFTVKK